MKKRSQLKLYALTCAFFACSSVAMENEDKQEENNTNLAQEQTLDLKKFANLYQQALKIDKSINKEDATSTTKLSAALEIWKSVSNEKDRLKNQIDLDDLLDIIEQACLECKNNIPNSTLKYIIVENIDPEDDDEDYDDEIIYSNLNPKYCTFNYNKKLVKILVNKGVDVNFCLFKNFSKSTSSASLLHIAAIKNSVHWINFLLDKIGADINCTNRESVKMSGSPKTPIAMACEHNNLEAVEALLKYKDIKINMADSKGRTPLYWAVKNKNLEMAELLVKKGAQIGEAPKNEAVELLKKYKSKSSNEDDDEDNDNEVIPGTNIPKHTSVNATNSKSYEVKPEANNSNSSFNWKFWQSKKN